ncbi:unnamed protein product [Durusdinium trenchii]|uniref:Uncharacterized protein n=1 Tax=Durusdinium trenchii TaxID=1381693 RepID=A0ABP0P0S8_9DINO
MAQHASSQKYTERDGFGHLELWSWKAQEWWHLYQTARALIKRWRIPAQQWLSMLSGSKITTEGVQDLMLASQMLGSCREMDFLDRETWGLLSLDLDVNLLRPRMDVEGGRDRSALAQQWRAATGDVEELQSMARDGRGSPFRVSECSSEFMACFVVVVPLSASRGEEGGAGLCHGCADQLRQQPSPSGARPASGGGTLRYACVVCDGICGRSTALALPSLGDADLGGAPGSHELRPLVEPFLLEAPELRPLELIDGYCCDWQRVTFEVVRGALKPLWVCLILHQAEPTLPLLAHCLTFQDLDLPLEFPENVRWVHEQVLRTFGKFGNGKAFLIQDDMQRVYYSMAFDFSMQNNFTSTGQISFFQMPYIQVRYSQRRAQELLFVREGTTKRWTNSLRGHLWYLKLQQLVADNDGRPGSTLRWRFLKDEAARIPYTEIAEHAAAVFFPGWLRRQGHCTPGYYHDSGTGDEL